MAYFRFHKSRSILPGLRLNWSKSGPSVSLGPKGARLNLGPQGVRVTAGLPGTGLSLVHRSSWASLANGPAGKWNGKKPAPQEIDAYLSRMTKDQQRDVIRKNLAAASLADARAQRDAVEAHVAEHAAEMDDGDRSDLAELRGIYADAIATKTSEARRAVVLPLVLVGLGGLAMWGGITAGNGWLIAASLVVLLCAAATKGGQAFLAGLLKLLLGLMLLGVVALIIGAMTLIILAVTGHTNP